MQKYEHISEIVFPENQFHASIPSFFSAEHWCTLLWLTLQLLYFLSNDAIERDVVWKITNAIVSVFQLQNYFLIPNINLFAVLLN